MTNLDDTDLNGYTNLEEYLNSIDMTTKVQESPVSLSYRLRLENYPNPFNPVTHINYSLPQPAYVTLTL